MTSYNDIHTRFLNEVHPDFLDSYIIINGAYGDFQFLLEKNKTTLKDVAYSTFSKDIFKCLKHSNNSIKFNDVMVLKQTIRKSESFYNQLSNEPIESLKFIKPTAFMDNFHRTLFVCVSPIYTMALYGAHNVFKQTVLDDMPNCENTRNKAEEMIEHSIYLRDNGHRDICIKLRDIDLRGMNHTLYKNFVETLIYLKPLSHSPFINNIRDKIFDGNQPNFKTIIKSYITSLMIQKIKLREHRPYYLHCCYNLYIEEDESDIIGAY